MTPPLSLTTNPSGKLLIILDASAFKESACLLRLFNNVVIGYKTKINDCTIEFGSAFHKFRSIWRTKGQAGFGEALIAARDYYVNKPKIVRKEKAYLTDNFLQQTCIGYATKYQKDNFQLVIHDGEALVEPNTRFAFPYYVDDGMEILMAGTIDEISKADLYCIADAKTSGIRPDKIESYMRSYEMSPQMIFYRWSLKKYAEAYPDSIFGEIDRADCGVFIDGVFYAGKDAPVQFIRSRVMLFNDRTMKEFDELVKAKVKLLIEAVRYYIQRGDKPMREGLLNGACQTVYGNCKYFNACATPDKETYDTILESQFIKEQYNPLLHGE
jgi:hypothetical protein